MCTLWFLLTGPGCFWWYHVLIAYTGTGATVSPAASCQYRLCLINPRRACAAMVTVIWSVCLSVCPFSISPLEHLFVPEINVTYSTGKTIVEFSLKLPEIQHSPPLYGQCTVQRYAQLGYKANNRTKATWNTSQCETATYLFLSAALVSVLPSKFFVYVLLHMIVFCLAEFCIPLLHLHFIGVSAFSKTRFISACSDHTWRGQVLRRGFAPSVLA